MSGNTPGAASCDFCGAAADELGPEGFGVCRRCYKYELRPGMTVSEAIEALQFCASMKGVSVPRLIQRHRPLARWFKRQAENR